MAKPKEIAPGVAFLPITIANVYYVGTARRWVLVDSGTGGKAESIVDGAKALFGKGSKPECIFLTHGHFDHAGSAPELLEHWQVPVYAHPLERPFLTGRSPYPPFDPTVGGALALASRMFPKKTSDVGGNLHDLSAGQPAPGLEEWEWYHTPGHTAGHVSLYHRRANVLLAGDAFTTVDVDSYIDLPIKRQKVCRPPAPATTDWSAAERSVRMLSELRPKVIGCGHGIPMSGPKATAQLQDLAHNFPVPKHGRYVPEAARTDETGIRYVPPPVSDPLPKMAGLAALGIVAGVGIAVAARRRGSS